MITYFVIILISGIAGAVLFHIATKIEFPLNGNRYEAVFGKKADRYDKNTIKLNLRVGKDSEISDFLNEVNGENRITNVDFILKTDKEMFHVGLRRTGRRRIMSYFAERVKL